jgi:hypothetical protein
MLELNRSFDSIKQSGNSSGPLFLIVSIASMNPASFPYIYQQLSAMASKVKFVFWHSADIKINISQSYGQPKKQNKPGKTENFNTVSYVFILLFIPLVWCYKVYSTKIRSITWHLFIEN